MHNNTSNVLLSEQRIEIREYREGDGDHVYSYTSDPGVVEHLPWGPFTRSMAERFIERAAADQTTFPRARFELAVCVKGGALIGGCGLFITSFINREANICYWLGQPFWGFGYATEAARALLAFGIMELGLHRIVATCACDNVRSKRILEKLHMRREGVFIKDVWLRSRWRDSYIYAILDAEYNVSGQQKT